MLVTGAVLRLGKPYLDFLSFSKVRIEVLSEWPCEPRFFMEGVGLSKVCRLIIELTDTVSAFCTS